MNDYLIKLLEDYRNDLNVIDEESRDYDFMLGRIFMLEDLLKIKPCDHCGDNEELKSGLCYKCHKDYQARKLL